MRALSLVTALGLMVVAIPGQAQQAAPNLDRRLDKLESEMKAVQRKVFPGGNPRFFEPEITAPEAAPTTPDGVPASNPLTDLSVRVGEMERQLRTMTGQAEANEFKLRQLEASVQKMQGDIEFRLNALEGNGVPIAPGAPGAPRIETPGGPAPQVIMPAPGTTASVAPPPPTPAAEPAPAKAATAADAWQAAYAQVVSKNWPATERMMSAYLTDWPRSTRIPQAQYWLGRSHAERNQHAQAADAYLKVYNNHPRSERAADALIGLSNALIGIKNPQQACRVLGELESVYGSQLTPAQKTEAAGLRTRARCS
ncbi:tetratricopeptide repeat protein [Polymorphobacter sp.]|uniref:tetratricopeptide repeat protein n=1 Tax=Polymorphobacter sp. TaxID=1909290 RepID=UPI003F71C7D1